MDIVLSRVSKWYRRGSRALDQVDLTVTGRLIGPGRHPMPNPCHPRWKTAIWHSSPTDRPLRLSKNLHADAHCGAREASERVCGASVTPGALCAGR